MANSSQAPRSSLAAPNRRSRGWLAWQLDGRLVGVCFRGRLRLRQEERFAAALDRIAERFPEPCDVIVEVAELAFEHDLVAQDHAKTAVLVGSIIAGVLAAVALRVRTRRGGYGRTDKAADSDG